MRLIDADHIRERHCGDCTGIGYQTCLFDQNFCHTMNWVDEEPTIDPVKHGHWIEDRKDYVHGCKILKCSECGNRILVTNERFAQIKETDKYCRCCGAMMDGEP